MISSSKGKNFGGYNPLKMNLFHQYPRDYLVHPVIAQMHNEMKKKNIIKNQKKPQSPFNAVKRKHAGNNSFCNSIEVKSAKKSNGNKLIKSISSTRKLNISNVSSQSNSTNKIIFNVKQNVNGKEHLKINNNKTTINDEEGTIKDLKENHSIEIMNKNSIKDKENNEQIFSKSINNFYKKTTKKSRTPNILHKITGHHNSNNSLPIHLDKVLNKAKSNEAKNVIYKYSTISNNSTQKSSNIFIKKLNGIKKNKLNDNTLKGRENIQILMKKNSIKFDPSISSSSCTNINKLNNPSNINNINKSTLNKIKNDINENINKNVYIKKNFGEMKKYDTKKDFKKPSSHSPINLKFYEQSVSNANAEKNNKKHLNKKSEYFKPKDIFSQFKKKRKQINLDEDDNHKKYFMVYNSLKENNNEKNNGLNISYNDKKEVKKESKVNSQKETLQKDNIFNKTMTSFKANVKNIPNIKNLHQQKKDKFQDSKKQNLNIFSNNNTNANNTNTNTINNLNYSEYTLMFYNSSNTNNINNINNIINSNISNTNVNNQLTNKLNISEPLTKSNDLFTSNKFKSNCDNEISLATSDIHLTKQSSKKETNSNNLTYVKSTNNNSDSSTINQNYVKKKIKCMHDISKTGLSGEEKKVNQDNYFIFKNFGNSSDYIFMGVCDGHGFFGHEVSGYIKENLPMDLNHIIKMKKLDVEKDDLSESLKHAFVTENNTLLRNKMIDSTLSGSTCVSAIYTPIKLIIANIGDSRIILGRCEKGEGNQKIWKGINLSKDHKPSLPEEAERIKKKGGRIRPMKDEDGNFIGPLRVYMKDKDMPGLAMTRSFGDYFASTAGTISVPEVTEYKFKKEDRFIILASDGLFEFISTDEIVQIVKDYYNENEIVNCCEFLYKESCRRWLREEEDTIDDITIIVIFLEED